MPSRRPSRSPEPYAQYEVRTTFIRVPAVDWVSVKRGIKTEFRFPVGHSTQLWNVRCPTPVVAHYFNKTGGRDARLMVLEKTWREELVSISPESLEREGFESLAAFRRYWVLREKKPFTGGKEIRVFRVRPFTEEDRPALADALLEKLYGEFL